MLLWAVLLLLDTDGAGSAPSLLAPSVITARVGSGATIAARTVSGPTITATVTGSP